MKFLKISLILFLLQPLVSQAQILDQKKNLEKSEGYFNFYYDKKEDKIYLEVDKLDTQFLYTHFLTSGLGSNDIGLDRGQLGDGVVVAFKKAGNKLLLIEPNMTYRAETDNLLEKKSVEEAFARSVLFGFEIKEEIDEGTYLIDFTPFLMEDAHGVANRLSRGEHGAFKVDASKSALLPEQAKAFPENIEFEVMLTFKGEAKSGALRSVLPNSENATVVQHHSFVKLPDDNYEKRLFDPRSGAIYITYYDYASPVYEPIQKRFAVRHRLQKKDPSAAVSEPVEPIIYYLDPGTPEPVRSALLEGASWWNQAFESIGYKNAFLVKMLPEDADPLDVRYNVIQWVHRSTRGWSYGASVVDPRTGEIIKGHVSLGSLRIRQDFMIAQALLNKPFLDNDENHEPMMEMALARIRQLSAHEVGHTLGFAHNFAASVNDRASVMDYPHPQFRLKNGEIDLSDAYDTGIGEWDKVTVKNSYGDIPKGMSQKAFLDAVISEATAKGLQFITDSDARAEGGAHVNAHLWDNGKSAAEELKDVLKIRQVAISNFSEENIRSGEPFSVLEDVFVPLYFLHRYQTEAAVKLVGGLNYNYSVKGGEEPAVEVLNERLQKRAFQEVLQTLNAETLAISEEKLSLFPPRAYGYPRSRESFKSNTGVTFDAFGAPATASEMTLSLLLNPERAARLVQQHALDEDQLGLRAVLEEVVNRTIKTSQQNDYLQQVQYVIAYNALQEILALAVNSDSTPQVKAETNAVISDLHKWLKGRKNPLFRQMVLDIEQFRRSPEKFKKAGNTPKIPDGSPIGSLMCGGL
ncbi:zinc-dependent metalloprotease [Salinimicrobium soli]|uniref:zinc-dependent metalloprotease n=1 Tax=Salinimicrobium soli TaxID=1254399 RepID=UPI003AADA50B